ncbi:hypothetical protein GCM10009795_048880 [Nocardioides hankookensis]|uniref:Alpha/beta hydrolase n=1 Tax=Nocardioides hankookensis TaxID=443157 RepID=A0ABW1LFF4_9ACTN
MVALLLVPSPLLGPATWAPVAELLDARVAAVDDVIAAAADLDDVVLVPHSNAGLHAPRLAAAVAARATVYVDAALAGDGSDVGLAPPRFLDFLSGLADADGVLPPWTQWWDEDQVRGLFPDAATRRRVEAEQPQLPLTHFHHRVPVPAGWADRPSAYLAFGDTYADEIAFAHAHGRPAHRLDGRHLHQLVDPVAVAATITDLVAAL